jgi:protein-tyrosine phosphatase
MTYTEIHFHLLPSIDDGPSSIGESVELAAAAAAEGTRTIVTTPHVHPEFVTDPDTLPERVREVQAQLAASQIDVELRCGGELDLRMVERLSDAQLETIAHGPRGRRWLLLEAPLTGLDGRYTVAAEELRERGFAVVVAHPERALGRAEAGWRALEHELAAGSPLQINAWSVAGRYGQRVRDIAVSLLERAPRVVIASDAHGGPRMPALGLSLAALTSAGMARTEAISLVSDGPRSLLESGVSAGSGALAA